MAPALALHSTVQPELGADQVLSEDASEGESEMMDGGWREMGVRRSTAHSGNKGPRQMEQMNTWITQHNATMAKEDGGTEDRQ